MYFFVSLKPRGSSFINTQKTFKLQTLLILMTDSMKELMLKDHDRIRDILKDFEYLVHNNIREAKDNFSKFKWNLEKHLFVEEKAVFIISDSIEGEEVHEIFELLQEHGRILELLDDLEDSLDEGDLGNIKELGETLRRHAKYEDINFYPKLEGTLDESQRKEICDRIKEIVV